MMPKPHNLIFQSCTADCHAFSMPDSGDSPAGSFIFVGDAYLALTVTCCGDEKESPVKRSVFFINIFRWL